MSYPIVRHWRLNKDSKIRSLWMMYVRDADLSNHCQKSLIGVKSKKFSKGAEHGFAEPAPIKLDEAKAPFYYICGIVPGKENWHKNFHLAFRYKKDSVVEVKTPHGHHWIIEHAEQIPILPNYIDKDDPHYDDPEFRTCRNFWFGHFVKRYLEQEKKRGNGFLPGLSGICCNRQKRGILDT